eukprot:1711286-Amphidinium_carterae.1
MSPQHVSNSPQPQAETSPVPSATAVPSMHPFAIRSCQPLTLGSASIMLVPDSDVDMGVPPAAAGPAAAGHRHRPPQTLPCTKPWCTTRLRWKTAVRSKNERGASAHGCHRHHYFAC